MPYLFIVFIVVAQCILFLAHFAVYNIFLAAFRVKSPKAALTLKVIFVFLSLSFVFASFIAYGRYNIFTQVAYTSAVVWLGFLFYLMLAGLAYLLLSFILSKSNFLPRAAIILVTSAILISSFGVINARFVRVTETTPNIIVPEAWKGKKAVFISDVHLGQVFGRSFLEKIVARINELSPDIVFIGGDLYDGTKTDLKAVTEPLKNINSKFGTYFVTGNHEEFESPDEYLNELRANGVRVLNNEFIELDGLQIVGVDFHSTVGVDNFQNILMSIKYDRNKPIILLKHTPLNLDVAQAGSVSFQISGHTHRAQMFPLNFITKIVYRGYDYGLKSYKNMLVYTSSGVGTWGPPVKVGAPAEIVLINF